MSPDVKISITIPTYNRFALVKRAIAGVYDDPRIGEIVICDDASTDGSYQKLQEWVKDFPKIKLYRNEKNLDCYANKAQALGYSTWPWAILFDSDNVLGVDYLDRLYDIPDWDVNRAYLPVFAKPHFDYRQFEGVVVTSKNVRNYMDSPVFRCALNTANFFVCCDQYLRLWDSKAAPHTADSIFMNYRMLSAGKSLFFVPGLHYEHLVHADSHYKLNCHKTGGFITMVEKKLRALR